MSHNRSSGIVVGALLMIIVVILATPGACAQSKFKTLYKFTGGQDGGAPTSGLIFDAAGNLYGTTSSGGIGNCIGGCGLVFELTPNSNGGWTQSVLYTFCSRTNCADGAVPNAGLIFDQGGNLYGTTNFGGNGAYGWGTVFELERNPNGSWKERVLHRFTGLDDGGGPHASLISDQVGNLYGTTYSGSKAGVAFQLLPNADGSWKENVLYRFTGGGDGAKPAASLIFDQAGDLYGTTEYGGNLSSCAGAGCGVVFELTPNAGGNWKESVLYQFTGSLNGEDGAYPEADLIFDTAGNLYGTTTDGSGSGVVFKLTRRSDGSWIETVLRRFNQGAGGGYPHAGLIFDQAGSLYGTTELGGNVNDCDGGCGVVFKIALNSKGGWSETVLHYFVNHSGAYSFAGLISDSAGNLYGTTAGDGRSTFGSVFEVTPLPGFSGD
jgi:uncharacterized repeat protein (TIGR03803 family)